MEPSRHFPQLKAPPPKRVLNPQQRNNQNYIQTARQLRHQEEAPYNFDSDTKLLLEKYLKNKQLILEKLQQVTQLCHTKQTKEQTNKKINPLVFLPDRYIISSLCNNIYNQNSKSTSHTTHSNNQDTSNNNAPIKHLLIKCLNNQTMSLKKLNDFVLSNQPTSLRSVSVSHPSPHEVPIFLESTSQEVRTVIDLLKKRNNQTTIALKGSVNIIFAGPPGTGKTSLLNAIITILHRNFTFLCAQDFIADQISVIHGELAPLLEKDLPCVIAIDGIDVLHNETQDPNEILASYLDKAERKDRNRSNPHFIFLGTTNNIQSISPMIRERSRIIELEYPDDASRAKFLIYLLQKYQDINLSNCNEKFIQSLAHNTKGFSMRDLNILVTIAIENALEESSQQTSRTGDIIKLQQTHLTHAFNYVCTQKAKGTNADPRWWNYTKNFAQLATGILVTRTLNASADKVIRWLFSNSKRFFSKS